MLTPTEITVEAIARGRAIKRVNALTAVLCGGLPAAVLGILFSRLTWQVGRWFCRGTLMGELI